VPITVTAPRGVLTPTGERQVLPRLTAALAAASGAADNPRFIALIGGTVHLLEPSAVYGGGENRPLVLVELKLPDIGLPDEPARAAFITAATDVVDELTVAGHNRTDTWVNIVNAAPGGWGMGGRAYPADALVAALTGAP
jgi:phenylpyruvate tautomerase PptA (4-oxalocrotonate tautomerase family)